MASPPDTFFSPCYCLPYWHLRLQYQNFKVVLFAAIGHLEEENDRLHAQLKIIMEERELNQVKAKELMDENAKLQMEKQERYPVILNFFNEGHIISIDY